MRKEKGMRHVLKKTVYLLGREACFHYRIAGDANQSVRFRLKHNRRALKLLQTRNALMRGLKFPSTA